VAIALLLLLDPLFKFPRTSFAISFILLTPFDIAGFCPTMCAVDFELARKFARLTSNTGVYDRPHSDAES
jgi:hypothetical protein